MDRIGPAGPPIVRPGKPTIYRAGVSSGYTRRIIIASLQRDRPQTVLDLGCGVGAYGALIRRYVYPSPYLIGVDGWQPYLGSEMCRLYDELICTDIADVVDRKLRLRFDTVLCMDVIEHFEMGDARRLSDWLLVQPVAYLSTPLWNFKQGAVDGNERERHRSHFSFEQLIGWGWYPIAKVRWGREDKWIGAFRNARVDGGVQ